MSSVRTSLHVQSPDLRHSGTPVAGWPSSLRRSSGGALILDGGPLRPGQPRPLGRGLVMTAVVSAVHRTPFLVELTGPRPVGLPSSWLAITTAERAVIGPPQPATLIWSSGAPVRSCGLPADLRVGEIVALWLPDDPQAPIRRPSGRGRRSATSTLPVIRRRPGAEIAGP